MSNAVQAPSSSAVRESRDRQQPQQRAVVPPVDVFENEASITLLADLPGVERDQLHIRVDGDTLVLEATARTGGRTRWNWSTARRSARPTGASSPSAASWTPRGSRPSCATACCG